MEEEVRVELAEQFETEPEVIDEAVGMGWIPPTDFKGDMDNFRSPADFVKRGKEYIPFIKQQNKKLEEEIETYKVKFGQIETELNATKEQIKEKDRVMKKVLDLHESVSEREYQRALKTIQDQQKDAINNADGDTWQKLEEEKNSLQKPEKIETKKEEPQTPQEAPEFTEWKQENSWFNLESDDPNDESIYASVLEQKLIKKGYSGRALLDEITKNVKTRFPERFENPNRQNADLDSASTSGVDTTPKRKSYNDLPADAKSACDRFVKQGLYKDRNEYVKEYFEGE